MALSEPNMRISSRKEVWREHNRNATQIPKKLQIIQQSFARSRGCGLRK
jgi:hypothetical protein